MFLFFVPILNFQRLGATSLPFICFRFRAKEQAICKYFSIRNPLWLPVSVHCNFSPLCHCKGIPSCSPLVPTHAPLPALGLSHIMSSFRGNSGTKAVLAAMMKSISVVLHLSAPLGTCSYRAWKIEKNPLPPAFHLSVT